MKNEPQLDLSELLNDSLSLMLTSNSHTRKMFSGPKKNPYQMLLDQPPLETLGEHIFGPPKNIPEDEIGTPIQEFFRGANVLITGGTGFIGKLLTEKLIRSIPHIGHIYLLIRSKKGTNSQERFDKLLKDKLFTRMQVEVPDWLGKISVLVGDLAEPGMGLSETDRELLTEKIDVVFHSAADVRFAEPLRAAVQSNVIGSRRVLDLAKEMSHLKAYVHISTAYSQCVRRVVDEVVPKMSVNYKETLQYIENKTDAELEIETPRLLQGWPNTYTFTKALSEEMVVEERGNMPVCIFRPSAVFPTYKEPVRGWTDNLYGPLGLLIGAGHGIVHSFHGDSNSAVLEGVPVDYVANCVIAAAWRMGTDSHSTSIPVYNFTLTSVMPMLWKRCINIAQQNKSKWPYSRSIWYTSFFLVENQIFSELAFHALHTIPGIFIDQLTQLFGGKPRLTKLYKRIGSLKGQLAYFMHYICEFRNENVMSLWSVMDKEDKHLFYFDLRDFNIEELFLVSKLGTRYYFMKEDMDSIPAAEIKNSRLYWAHVILKMVCGVAVLKLLAHAARELPF